MSVIARDIFRSRYKFKNPEQNKEGNSNYALSQFAYMCWEEAFIWGWEQRDKGLKEAEKIINKIANNGISLSVHNEAKEYQQKYMSEDSYE